MEALRREALAVIAGIDAELVTHDLGAGHGHGHVHVVAALYQRAQERVGVGVPRSAGDAGEVAGQSNTSGPAPTTSASLPRATT